MAESLGPSNNSGLTKDLPTSDALKIPPRGDVIDRWQRHISLQEFGKKLQDAASSSFPNKNRSRYQNVYVLMIKWEDEDPKLPVSCEIEELRKVLQHIYHFEIEVFEIPDNRSHAKVSEKINAFVDINDDSENDLKIVYYAGHSKLSKTKDLVWSSWQTKNDKYSTVSWTGIQRALEQARSDVLILLDYCSSGIGDVGDGNGVTEVISACAFDVMANGVGHYSFTHALTTELRLLSWKISFPVSELYTHIYCRAQHHLAQDIANERYPAPIHLQLTRDSKFPRGLHLSVRAHNAFPTDNSSSIGDTKRPQVQSPSLELSCPTEMRIDDFSDTCHGTAASLPPASSPIGPSNYFALPEPNPVETSTPHQAPRLLLAIRFFENMTAGDLSVNLFREWLRTIPAAVEDVQVEAAFHWDSTLLLVSVPFSLWPYISQHPAIIELGHIKSQNLLPARNLVSYMPENQVCSSNFAEERRNQTSDPENISAQEDEVDNRSDGRSDDTYSIISLSSIADKTVSKETRDSDGSSASTKESQLHRPLPLPKSIRSKGSGKPKSLKRSAAQNHTHFPLKTFPNVWHEEFFIHHDLSDKDNVPAVEIKKIFGGAEDVLEIFREDDDYSPTVLSHIIDYCSGVQLKNVDSAIGKGESRRRAWIDDRNSPHLEGSGNVRQGGTWLTATGLWRYLKNPRHNWERGVDAERRLIYIADLRPENILALTGTVSCLQIRPLRNAIFGHVALRPSIGISIPSNGTSTFWMEFHLPFFALRKLTSDRPRLRNSKKQLRRSEELTLSTRDRDEDQRIGPHKYLLYEAHVSCVVSGIDEWHWTAYAFEDTEHNLEADYQDVYRNETENNQVAFNEDHEDPIICTMGKHPIWRPRQYFLKAFEHRARIVWEEWSALVSKLEDDFYACHGSRQLNPRNSSPSSHTRALDLGRRFNQTSARQELLTKLLCVLSNIIAKWDKFVLPDGDIGYLSDLDDCSKTGRRDDQTAQSVRNIRAHFRRLKNVHGRLIALKQSSASDMNTLEILQSLENNETSEKASFLNQMILWLRYSYVITTVVFSLQPTFLPFDFTFRRFCITMLFVMLATFIIRWVTQMHSIMFWYHAIWKRFRKLHHGERFAQVATDKEP